MHYEELAKKCADRYHPFNTPCLLFKSPYICLVESRHFPSFVQKKQISDLPERGFYYKPKKTDSQIEPRQPESWYGRSTSLSCSGGGTCSIQKGSNFLAGYLGKVCVKSYESRGWQPTHTIPYELGAKL